MQSDLRCDDTGAVRRLAYESFPTTEDLRGDDKLTQQTMRRFARTTNAISKSQQ